MNNNPETVTLYKGELVVKPYPIELEGYLANGWSKTPPKKESKPTKSKKED